MKRSKIRLMLSRAYHQVRIPLSKKYRLLTSHMRTLPAFVIIGVQKGGTTSLFRYLAKHPCVGRTYKKEPHYYAWNYSRGRDWYQSNYVMRKKIEKKTKYHGVGIVGEASTHYIFYRQAAERMHSDNPDMKLILLLRNPIERAFSHWRHNVKQGREERNFELAIARELAMTPEQLNLERYEEKNINWDWCEQQYLNHGLYLNQIQDWLSIYRKEQLLVLSSEDFFCDTESVFRQVLDFLGLPKWQPKDGFPVHNSGIDCSLNKNTRKKLEYFYAEPNKQLELFLGQSFDW